MKRSKYILFILVLSALQFSSCRKALDQASLGSLSEEIVANKEGVNSVLIGAYAALDGMQGDNKALGGGDAWQASPSNWVFGTVAGGDANKGSGSDDQADVDPIVNFYSNATNIYFNSKWRAVFEGVSRANNVLKLLAKAKDIPEKDRPNIMGQARFLRAHYYFELKKMWNMVPYIDENTTDYNQPNNVDLWPKITADLDYAYKNLPTTQPDLGRANKWAAGAYLAKAYLYQHKFAEAKAIYDVVIPQGNTSSGIPYGLNEEFADNYKPSKENNGEAVFAIQMTANADPSGPTHANNGDMLNFPYEGSPFGCCGFTQPSIDMVNHYRTNEATGLPYLTDFNQHAIKNDMGVSADEPYTPDNGTIDPRLDWTAGRRGIPYLDWGIHPGETWVRKQAYGGPYSPKKNAYWQATAATDADLSTWAPGSAINYLIIRFADVLLMAAECEAQTGNLSEAQRYVNIVRARAANPKGWVYKYLDNSKPMAGFSNIPAANYKINKYPDNDFASKGLNYALSAIYFERKLELGMEGHRFFDLVRWGIAEQELNAYFSYQGKLTEDVSKGKFIKGKSEYYPIPQRQIDLSQAGGAPVLKQNPGYN